MFMRAAPLAIAVLLSATAAAQAGGYERYSAPAGTVNNYYGPTTVYQGAAPAYGQTYGYAYPAQGSSYSSAYGNATAGAYADAYAGSAGNYSGYGYYGADYGAPWGEPFAGGVGYSPYGNYGGSYGYGAPVHGARMDPWNGYNGGRGNGYW